MKDNLNIEELFKEKFSSFEGDVSPDAWTNIQQGMNVAGAAGSSAGATGMSLLTKTIIISGGIVAATVATVVLLPDTKATTNTEESNLVVNDDGNNSSAPVLVEDAVEAEGNSNNTVDASMLLDEESAAENDVVDTEINGVDEIDVSGGEGAPLNDTETENGVGEWNGADVEGEDPSTKGDVEPDQTPVGGSDDRVTDPVDTTPDAIVKKHVSTELEVIPGDQYAPTTYTFISNAENARKVEWVFEDGTILTDEEVEYTFEKPGTYEVTLNAYGNGEIASKTTTVIIASISKIETLPNTITPNGDHLNDFFAIKTVEIETFYIVITDAKGNKIFESDDPNFRWYGVNEGGERLPDGVYYYNFFAKGTDGEKHAKANQIVIQ